MYCKYYPLCKKAHHKKRLCKFDFLSCILYKRLFCPHNTFNGKEHCMKCNPNLMKSE